MGLKDDVTILDNVVCVPVEMSGVYAKAAKGRHALVEGLSFEILAKVTPLDTSIAAFEQDDKTLIELKIYGKADEDKAAKSTVNGTMKFMIADVEEDEKKEKKGKVMVSDLRLKVNGGGYGIVVRVDEKQKATIIDDVKVAVCPECGYTEMYLEDLTNLKD